MLTFPLDNTIQVFNNWDLTTIATFWGFSVFMVDCLMINVALIVDGYSTLDIVYHALETEKFDNREENNCSVLREEKSVKERNSLLQHR